MLYWVFHDPEKRAQDGASRCALANYRWIGAAILAYLVVEVAAAPALACPAQGAGHSSQHRRVSRGLFMIGMFFNQFLPGGTGGDIVKCICS